MADREEVLKGLEHHRHLEASRNELGHDECFDCPYRPYGEDTCASLDRMIDDALELLKEQPKLKAAHWVKMKGMMPPEFTGHFECDNCGWHGKLNERETDYNFCPGCGAKMSVGTPTIDEIDLSNPLLDEVIEMLEYIAYMRRITDECGANTNKQNEKEK